MNIRYLFLAIFTFFGLSSAWAAKLVEVKVVDKDYIHLVFLDGEVTFRDDANGTCPHDHCEDIANSIFTPFGNALNTNTAQQNSTYRIKSSDDATFGTGGLQPYDVFRKSKISGMNQKPWSTGENDYQYDVPFVHHVFLQLPQSLTNGKTYTVEIAAGTNTDQTSISFTYDIFNTRSEAIKVNVVGYNKSEAIKAADLYMWMGDGNGRDFTAYTGNKIYIYNTATLETTEVGTVGFHAAATGETRHGHKMTQADVWNLDFTSFNTPGQYRLAVEGIGCSDDFEIKDDIYRDPFAISVLGFFYMRIGQETYYPGNPIPRQPLWIPNQSPANTTVYITTMQPYHPEWDNMCSGCDKWDIKAGTWTNYVKPGNPTNPNAIGGHSDALDWDRHLGHVSIIYDMLLPYIITGGSQSDDDIGIAESGNGIPDLLDEAQNEVDFWLNLRDGAGYSHGINNPDGNNVFYQAGTTTVAAWANAANAAMLAYAYDIAGQNNLREVYKDSAEVAFNYASAQTDKQFDKTQGVGFNQMSGRDFQLLAAAYLYNLTGDQTYENLINAQIGISGTTSNVNLSNIYTVAGYLFTPQTVNYPTLQANMKASLIYQAKQKEANYIYTRPTRRASDNDIGWMQTEIGVHRTMVAHAVADEGADKTLFEQALLLEADYSLGRNPENRILMTTATTSLANKRSIENAFTSGWDDGFEGVHPGHTPYMNPYDWGGLKMGRPSWMADQSYPVAQANPTSPANLQWPMGEMYFNTRFVYAHSEFTPQQTMRGKTALYAYLYGLGPNCDKPNLGSDVSICGLSELTLDAGISATGRMFSWTQDGAPISGADKNTLTVTEAGTYEVTFNESGCVKTSKVDVLGDLPVLNLGDDIELCSPSVKTLDTRVAGAGITFEWEKDGQILNGEDEAILEVIAAGTYTATISASGCGSASDEIVVGSLLLNVINDSLCVAGEANLNVVGTDAYTWHAGAETNDLLASGNNYKPLVSSTTTFYVEQAGSISGTVGRTEPGNSTWGSWADSYNHHYKFTVLAASTLKSIDVHATGAGLVNVNLFTDHNASPIETVSVNVSNGTTTIDLNFDLTPGVYYLNAEGSDASLTMDNENGTYVAYPYVLTDVISIDGIEPSWASTRYLHFYNWQVSAGNPCERTPVKAVMRDASDDVCIVTSTQLISEDGLENVYPNPTSGLVYLPTETQYAVQAIDGRVVQEGFGKALDLSTLDNGIYLIKTELGSIKIIKQ